MVPRLLGCRYGVLLTNHETQLAAESECSILQVSSGMGASGGNVTFGGESAYSGLPPVQPLAYGMGIDSHKCNSLS